MSALSEFVLAFLRFSRFQLGQLCRGLTVARSVPRHRRRGAVCWFVTPRAALAVAASAAGALVAVTFVALPDQAAAASSSASAPGKPSAVAKVGSRPDPVSARLTARVQKSRVEVASLRTPESTTFAEPDGGWTTEVAAAPVRFKTAKGEWRPNAA
jgi:hypothetical protein